MGTFSSGYYGNSAIAGESYNRWDFTYLNSFKLGGSFLLGLRMTGAYLGTKDHAYQLREGNRAIHYYEDTWHYRAELSLSF